MALALTATNAKSLSLSLAFKFHQERNIYPMVGRITRYNSENI